MAESNSAINFSSSYWIVIIWFQLMPLNPQFKIQTCKLVRYLLICGILVKAPTYTGVFNSKFCLTAIRRGETDDRAEGARHRNNTR